MSSRTDDGGELSRFSVSERHRAAAAVAVDRAVATLRTLRSDLGRRFPKDGRDFATDADLEVERLVAETLEAATPEIGFFGEERGGADVSSGVVWVLDPIDGTVNHARDVPLWGVSLALMVDGCALHAVVDLPVMGERFVATKRDGATLNGTTIRVSKVAELAEAVCSVGDFSRQERNSHRQAIALDLISNLAAHSLRVRMFGTAAVDLSYVAAGRIDLAVTLSNHPWDVSAGILLVREAGGSVVDIDGSPHNLSSTMTIASNGRLDAATATLFDPTMAK